MMDIILHCRLLSVALVSIFISTISAQNPDMGGSTECCDLNLMDAHRQVAIETDQLLPPGTYRAVRVRACTTDPVALQVWTRLSPTQFQFKWQTQFIATVEQTNMPYFSINLGNNPITITASDRLGVYNPSNASLKIPIPYDRDTSRGSQYLSLSRFTGSQFTPGQMISLDSLRWSRTLMPYVQFCATTNDCPAPQETTTVSIGRGPPGEPGPPGPCCPIPFVPSCDPNGNIDNGIDRQSEQVRQLEDKVRELQRILDNLLKSNVITGICPDGFVSGVYGVGSCYLFRKDERLQMAQAVIKCRDNYAAGLLKIQSALEDTFIKNYILNNTSPGNFESYWTAGMYNIPLRNWYWYDENFRIKAPYNYRNWRNGMEPAPLSIYDVCSVFTVDVQASRDYWEKNECTLTNYYICEVPKKCF